MDKDTDKFTWDTTNKVLTGINIKESTWANLAAANKALAGMKAKVDAVVLAYFKS